MQDAFKSARDIFDMIDWIVPTGTAKRSCRKVPQTMIGEVKSGMLTGHVEMNGDAPPRQLQHDRGELDGFGSGPDNETYARIRQFSPWLRRRIFAPLWTFRQAKPRYRREIYLKLSA